MLANAPTSIKLKVLGCSGGIGDHRATTSFLVDNDILLDAGTGVSQLSLQQMHEIRHVFLTHSHLDHVAALPLFLDSIFDLIHTPVTVHALKETIHALQTHIFNNVIWPDFSQLPNKEHPVLTYHVMEPLKPLQLGHRTIRLIPVDHTVPAAGIYVSSQTGGFAFSGDTTHTEQFWQQLNEYELLNVLVVESAFPEQDITISDLSKHFSPQKLASDLEKLRHHPEVWISHPKPGAEKTIELQCKNRIRQHDIRLLTGGELFEF